MSLVGLFCAEELEIPSNNPQYIQKLFKYFLYVYKTSVDVPEVS